MNALASGFISSAFPPIALGETFAGKAVDLDVTQLTNFSGALIGESGTGKTYSLRRITTEYLHRGITPFVIDSQGDMTAELFGVPDEMVVEHDIQHGPSGVSLNPFRMDRGSGNGAYFLAIEDAIEAFRIWKTDGALGVHQESTLRKLLSMTYSKKGIMEEDPTTWYNNPIPDWTDFEQTLAEQLTLIPTVKDAQRAEKELSYEELVEKFMENVNEIGRGRKYLRRILAANLDEKTLRSLASMAYGMSQSGLFGSDDVDMVEGKINIYRIKNLRMEGKKVVIRMLLDRIFSWAMRASEARGLNRNVPDVIIVLDEAKLASATSRNKLSSLARIATEGRKFGLGILCGVQHLGQLDPEVRKSTAFKLLLPVESTMVNDTLKLFDIKREVYDSIKPRSDALLQINGAPMVPIHLWRE